jgi:hypothetical protein
MLKSKPLLLCTRWDCILNLYEAIDLLGVISNFHFGTSETPKFYIYDQENRGHTLWTKTDLVSEENLNFLKKIIKSRKLQMRETNGYLVLG